MRKQNIIITIIIFFGLALLMFLLWWFLIKENKTTGCRSRRRSCKKHSYDSSGFYDSSCSSSQSGTSWRSTSSSSSSSSSCSSSSDNCFKTDYTNTQNVVGTNSTFATKHAVSSIGAIIVDQQVSASTTKLHLYTKIGDSFYDKATFDVPGIYASVSASDKYLFCATQAADLSDNGMAFVFSKSDLSWVEIQRFGLASKPVAVDSYKDLMLIRFTSMVTLYKDGVQDFTFNTLVPLDAKIYDDKIFLSTAGSAYLFKKKKTGAWDVHRSFVGANTTFGQCVDLDEKFLAVKDTGSIYIYKMNALDSPIHKITITSNNTHYFILGYKNIVIWQNEAAILYDYECETWSNTKTISMAGSLNSYVSYGDGYMFLSKEIGAAANVGLSVWKRHRKS